MGKRNVGHPHRSAVRERRRARGEGMSGLNAVHAADEHSEADERSEEKA
ncbi:hypothetical protein [Catellatospora paridis]|nr:hypothetical protein [Catellatospora paridis]